MWLRGLLLAGTLLASGCVTDTAVETEDGGGAATAPGSPSDGPPPGSEGGAAAGGGVDDDGPIGSAGPALLAGSSAAATVEVDRSPSAGLTIDPRAVIGEELREHGGKQSIGAAGDSTLPAKAVYTAGDLRAMAGQHRASGSEPGRPAVYVMVLEGRYENDRVTGVAFSATSFAVFPDRIGGGPLGLQGQAFEEAVVVHELGHLFGLVNLTGHGGFHEDPEHPGHAASRDSVMYWAVEDVSLRNVFSGGPPTEFDEGDREEMNRIRGG